MRNLVSGVFGLAVAALLVLAASCRSRSGPVSDVNDETVARELFATFRDGEINRCKLNDKTVWSCGQNAYDAGLQIFDEKGTKIGECLFSTGMVDEICNQIVDCEAVWRQEKNIWGLPGVNLYGFEN